jgi:chromosome segregation ATPase
MGTFLQTTATVLAILTPLCAFGYFVWRLVKPRLDALRNDWNILHLNINSLLMDRFEAKKAIADITTRLAQLQEYMADMERQQDEHVRMTEKHIDMLVNSNNAIAKSASETKTDLAQLRAEVTALESQVDKIAAGFRPAIKRDKQSN